jgi:hypothetical protein
MRHWTRALLAASLLSYASSDYEFRYPDDLVVLQDFVYSDATIDGSKHVVVLRHKDAELGDLRSIEINMLAALNRAPTCQRYTSCREIDGIVIGTNSQDEDFLKAFGAVARSFKRR